LPPEKDIETKAILKKTIKASRSLAELKQLVFLLPDYNILLNNLVLLEAKDSSEIENIVTTHDTLYKALSASKNNADSNVKEVLNYKDAVWEGVKLIKTGVITTNIICDIQKILIENNAGIRKLPGTKIANKTTGEIIYTPPDGENKIRNKLANLENFINMDDDGMDPLIKLAIMHYQFEAIHPFYDGNGRAGRILNILFLIYKGLLRYPVLYLSSYIIENKPEYYKRLREVTFEGNWFNWIEYVLEAIEITAKRTIRLVNNIKAERDSIADLVREKLPNIYSGELIDILFSQPYCKVKLLVDKGIGVRQTVGNYLREFEKIGILKSEKSGTEKLYLNQRLINVLKSKV